MLLSKKIEKSTQSNTTSCPVKKHVPVSTDISIIHTGKKEDILHNCDIEYSASTKPIQQEEKPNILLVSGVHGINCGLILNKLVGNRYNTMSIVKPNSDACKLFKTCTQQASLLTKRDIVIVWTNSLNTKRCQIRQFVNSLKYTSVLVISEPYYYNQRYSQYRNKAVFEFNTMVFEEVQLAAKYSKITFFDSNSLLNSDHFMGNKLKRDAKSMLLKNLIKYSIFGGLKEPVITSVNTIAQCQNQTTSLPSTKYHRAPDQSPNNTSKERPNKELELPESTSHNVGRAEDVNNSQTQITSKRPNENKTSHFLNGGVETNKCR